MAEPKINWKVRLDTKGLGVKIYVNDLLFFFIRDYQQLTGLQSWKQGKDYYCIEVYMKENVIKLDFNDYDKWKSILNLLDEL